MFYFFKNGVIKLFFYQYQFFKGVEETPYLRLLFHRKKQIVIAIQEKR